MKVTTSNKRNLKENKGVNQGQGQIRKESVEGTTGGVSLKKFSDKHRKIHMATLVWESLIKKVAGLSLQP